MNENTTGEDQETTPAAPRRSRKYAIIGGGVALALVATAAIAIPRYLHAQRVDEYHSVMAEIDAAIETRSAAQTQLNTTMALSYAQHGEALELAHRIVDIGDTAEPILTGSQAQGLTDAGIAVIETIGEPFVDTEDRSRHLLITAVEELAAQDEEARKAAEEAGEEAPAPVAPQSFLSLKPEDVTGLVDVSVAPDAAERLADKDVTDEAIEAARAELTGIESEIEELETRIAAENDILGSIADALGTALPVLRSAVDDASAQSEVIAEQSGKAPDAVEVVLASGQRAQDLSSSDDIIAMIRELEWYVEAAEAAQTAHEEIVQKEKEEAERKAKEEAERKKRSGGGRSGRSGLCNRFSPGFGGNPGSLILVPCQY